MIEKNGEEMVKPDDCLQTCRFSGGFAVQTV
jgi:hypothetical protein